MIMSTKEICKRGLSMTISLTLGNSVFPLADGGAGDVKRLRHLLLGQAPPGAQVPQEWAELARFHKITSASA